MPFIFKYHIFRDKLACLLALLFRPWVMTEQGQQDKLGMTMECKK